MRFPTLALLLASFAAITIAHSAQEGPVFARELEDYVLEAREVFDDLGFHSRALDVLELSERRIEELEERMADLEDELEVRAPPQRKAVGKGTPSKKKAVSKRTPPKKKAVRNGTPSKRKAVSGKRKSGGLRSTPGAEPPTVDPPTVVDTYDCPWTEKEECDFITTNEAEIAEHLTKKHGGKRPPVDGKRK